MEVGRTPQVGMKLYLNMTKINNILCPEVFSLLKGKEANYENLHSAFVEYCNNFSELLNLCGLSLGGILALNYVIDYPEKVKTLVLICTPHKIQSILFNIQTIIFKILPKPFFKFGLQKNDMFKLANSMKKLDFSHKLKNITCPTLVICGAKDSINMKSAKYLSENIKNANIKIIKTCSHYAKGYQYKPRNQVKKSIKVVVKGTKSYKFTV
jgi:pimeloyl-ACP methyl ester carboxylesterase